MYDKWDSANDTYMATSEFQKFNSQIHKWTPNFKFIWVIHLTHPNKKRTKLYVYELYLLIELDA